MSAPVAAAQVSLPTAVDLALRNSPRVKLAADDVAKARAQLDQTRDIFIPAVSVGAGLGNSYGYSPYPPTLFTFSATSLIYNSSQFDYIRASKAGLRAAQLALDDVREAVAEDAAVTYAAVTRDRERQTVLHQQLDHVQRLVSIVQDRLDAGRDTTIDLTTAKINEAQLRLSVLRGEDDAANDASHLATLLGLSSGAFDLDAAFPALPALPATSAPVRNLGVAAAFATAKSRQQQAWGDARFLYRPQFQLIIQYNRYATFADSFKQIQLSQPTVTPNQEVFGMQVSLPLLDRVRTAKARESAADAAHAFHDAENIRRTQQEGQGKLTRSVLELETRAEVATLEQQLAQQQLDAIVAQQNASTANGPAITPKDEQTARIAEREKYLSVVDAAYQVRVARIGLLRQSGQLQAWLRGALPVVQALPPNAQPSQP